jgi:hypothetical protein
MIQRLGNVVASLARNDRVAGAAATATGLAIWGEGHGRRLRGVDASRPAATTSNSPTSLTPRAVSNAPGLSAGGELA